MRMVVWSYTLLVCAVCMFTLLKKIGSYRQIWSSRLFFFFIIFCFFSLARFLRFSLSEDISLKEIPMLLVSSFRK